MNMMKFHSYYTRGRDV